MTRLIAFAAVLCLVPGLALAEGRPSAVEIKKVLDYYYGEKSDSVVLVETQVCPDIVTKGQMKNECTETFASSAVQMGKPSYLWMNFLVPASLGEQTVLVQFEHNGVTRMTRQVKVSGSVRYRTWKKFALDRPGTWSVKILQDKGSGVEQLTSMTLKAQEPPVASAPELSAPKPVAVPAASDDKAVSEPVEPPK